MLKHLESVQKLGGGQVTVGAFMRKGLGPSGSSTSGVASGVEGTDDEGALQQGVKDTDLETVGTLAQIRSITWSEESGKKQVCVARTGRLSRTGRL